MKNGDESKRLGLAIKHEKPIESEYPVLPRTAENYRFVKRISIAGVSFLENRGSVMASTNVGDTLRLVREPDNSHDSNAIRIDQNGGQKLGYIPRMGTAASTVSFEKRAATYTFFVNHWACSTSERSVKIFFRPETVLKEKSIFLIFSHFTDSICP